MLVNNGVSAFQALDKIRFLSLTDKEILGEGDNSKLEIQVSSTFILTYCFLITSLKKAARSG